jgi:hypothetical protein
VLSGYDFAEISLWSLVWEKKLNFFGLLPNTRAEGWRTLYGFLMATYQRSWFMNLLPSCCDFAEISFWSLVLKKKTQFLWPTSEHRGQEFGERSIVP